MRAAFSVTPSALITSSVAIPAAIARSFLENVEPWTTARSMRLNTLSKIHLRISTAPTGTWPPESALASSTMSGSMPQCSTARNLPVRPMPGLDLVGDEQRPVAAAKVLHAAQIVLVRQDHALALDRLDDERRDAARRERLLERREVVERDAHAVRQQRLEAFRKSRRR